MPFLKEEFTRWARAALSHYPVKEYSLKFLGHSDNLTFRVEEAGGTVYLLRLHEPVTAYYRGMRQLPEAISSELAWMEALLQHSDVTIQQPVHAVTGELVIRVEVEKGMWVPCTLFTWLEGEHFSPAAPGAEDFFEQMGRLVARMHVFSSQWAAPAGLVRPVYDHEHFRRIFARLLRGVDHGVFSEDIYRILRATGQEILDEIDRVSDGPEYWGMIHADLHLGNFLLQGENIIPIDFSFCGFGHYLYDLSICLTGGLKPALRPAFLNGYRSLRSLPESSLRAIEAYALAGRVNYYAFHIDQPAERKWLQVRIPHVAEKECSRFLRGESILEII